MSARFVRHTLRALDPESAAAFYSQLLGAEPEVVALPPRARAAGAPAHWIGWLGVDERDAFAARWLAQGARRLGPPDSPIFADPTGAVLGLCEPGEADARPVHHALHCHHELHCADVNAAVDAYAPCGWTAGPVEDALGLAYRRLDVGGAVESVPRGAHPHWLHSFPVAALDDALERARSLGANVIHQLVGLDGAPRAALDDPEGAAFGLWVPP